MALGYLSFSLLMWLSRMGIALVSDKEWFDCYLSARDAVIRYRPTVEERENSAKYAALALKDADVVMIWGNGGITDFAACSMKNLINENANRSASWCTVPEVNHNEIMAMDGKTVVFLRNKGEHPRVSKRFVICGKLLWERECTVIEHWGRGETSLGRAVESLSYGTWASYYLALLDGIDPSEIAAIDNLKCAMKQQMPSSSGR